MVDDFGPDFDAEGNELEEGESDRDQVRGGARQAGPHGRGRGRGDEAEDGEPHEDEEEAATRLDTMATQKDVKNRISSVKNIRKITRAMEMVAAARLRRAEQRIDAMRPYAQAIRADDPAGRRGRRPRRQPRRAAAAAREVKRVGIILVTGDRGLAGSFNTQIIRAGARAPARVRAEGAARSPTTWSAAAATRR